MIVHQSMHAGGAGDAPREARGCETDCVEVVGLWKSERGKVHSKYHGNHYRLIGTLVRLYFGVIPDIIGYYVGRLYMYKAR